MKVGQSMQTQRNDQHPQDVSEDQLNGSLSQPRHPLIKIILGFLLLASMASTKRSLSVLRGWGSCSGRGCFGAGDLLEGPAQFSLRGGGFNRLHRSRGLREQLGCVLLF